MLSCVILTPKRDNIEMVSLFLRCASIGSSVVHVTSSAASYSSSSDHPWGITDHRFGDDSDDTSDDCCDDSCGRFDDPFDGSTEVADAAAAVAVDIVDVVAVL